MPPHGKISCIENILDIPNTIQAIFHHLVYPIEQAHFQHSSTFIDKVRPIDFVIYCEKNNIATQVNFSNNGGRTKGFGLHGGEQYGKLSSFDFVEISKILGTEDVLFFEMISFDKVEFVFSWHWACLSTTTAPLPWPGWDYVMKFITPMGTRAPNFLCSFSFLSPTASWSCPSGEYVLLLLNMIYILWKM